MHRGALEGPNGNTTHSGQNWCPHSPQMWCAMVIGCLTHEKDNADQLCVDPVGDLPRCMDMITAEEVARRIEMYFAGGAITDLRGGRG